MCDETGDLYPGFASQAALGDTVGTGGRALVLSWINGVAVAVTLVLAWGAAGQLSLLVHGRSLDEERPKGDTTNVPIDA